MKFNSRKFGREHRINDEIKSKFVILIDENSKKVGSVPLFEAKQAAKDAENGKGMDLVQVGFNGTVPICKIMDYGKFCFELKKNKAKAKRENKQKDNKEIQVRPIIEKNDFEVKLKSLKSFLNAGSKVNVILKFRARQNAHPEIGLAVLNKFKEAVQDISKAESEPKVEGRKAVLTLNPLKK